MSWDQPGLRRRLEQEGSGIATQHRQIRELITQLERQLQDSSRDTCQATLSKLRRALRAHFTLEEDVIFPALRGLNPDLASDLAALDREHRSLWEQLEGVERTVDGALVEDATASFASFRRDLRSHEITEETLFAEMRR